MTGIKRFYLLLAIPLLLVSHSLSVHAAEDAALTAFKAAIRAKYDVKVAAFNKKDAETIVTKVYAADAISVPPGNAYIAGREKLLESYKKHMDGTIRIESFKTYVHGDSGYDLANFHVKPDNAAEKPYTLKMLFLWEKRNGEWWCVGDMFMPGAFPTAAQ